MKLLLTLVTCITMFSVFNTKSAEPLFNSKEFGVTLSAGTLLNPENSVQTTTTTTTTTPERITEACEQPSNPETTTTTRSVRHHSDHTVNFTVGVFYFPTKVLGLEANLPVYQTSGVSVQEVQAGLLLRVPLFNKCPVLRHFAPYAGVGTVYNWYEGDRWSYVGKGGLECRLTRNVGLFGEFQYRNVDFNLDQGSKRVQAGLRLAF